MADDAIPLGDDEPIELMDDDPQGGTSPPPPPSAGSGGSTQIQQFGGPQRSAKKWNRQPNITGQGATHVKSFHAKLRADALDFLDEQINDWLDAHPECEVKFVTTTVGELRGKNVEPAMFVNVWV